MSSQRPSPAAQPRKALALKRADGEPLTRSDLQYDLLCNVFNDTQAVFTNPSTPSGEAKRKVTFKELYLNSILNSPKATKVLKDKMLESDAFKEDFGMLALLVNVGRVNTTMSFFPEMKTAIRTYHPVPALQRTQGNLQDAPRIKHILKSAVLGNGLDSENTPSTPADIVARVKAGHIPPTTVMNLIFVLANHSSAVGQLHLQDGIDFNDLFARDDISSASRAQAFLWLCYHYLEAPTETDDEYDDDQPDNPFGDNRRDNKPTFAFMSEAEIAQENVDTEEERVHADKLIVQRADALTTQEAKREAKEAKAMGKGAQPHLGDAEELDMPLEEESKQKGKRGPKAKEPKEKKAVTRRKKGTDQPATATNPMPRFASDEEMDSSSITALVPPVPLSEGGRRIQALAEPVGRNKTSVHRAPALQQPTRSKYRYMPYQTSLPAPHHKQRFANGDHRPPITPRSMLHQAWHVITTTDPLYDSEDEIGDEYMRYDYIKRLQVVDMLRDTQFVPVPELESNRYP